MFLQRSFPSAKTRRAETVLSAVVCLLIGAFLIFGVGFVHSDVIHSAAHDSRHSFAFPCH